jgi:VWFA-related protein
MESVMRAKHLCQWLLLILLPATLWSTVVRGQNPNQQQGTVFRSTTNFVRTDVIVRDQQGRFVPDLKVADFRVYEDGVLQNVTLFNPWIGGRSLGNLATVGALSTGRSNIEGLVLPAVKPKTDSSGRLFIVFIDDLHILPGDTPRVKALLGQVRDILVHDNDLVGFVSTGTSSVEIDPSYDFGHRRFNEAISKVMGSGTSADEIIDAASSEGSQGPQQLRFNVHTSFRTAYGILDQLALVTDRRKAFVYVSSGYDFNPFSDSRLKKIQEAYAQPKEDNPEDTGGTPPPDEAETLRNEEYHKRTAFSGSDLVNEVAQLTRAAQRANVAFYPIDPRGLIAGGMDAATRTQIAYADWRDYFQTTISTLQVLAEETGGFAVVNTNDFEKGIRRIDSDTSDFYQIGYISSNPDPRKIRRVIKIEIARPGLQEPMYRSEYTIPRTRR